jgi:hypothetical protein
MSMSVRERIATSAESLVAQYFDALRTGRIVDALDVFATDATLLDAQGVEHRGIRSIAAAFARAREPMRIEILALVQDKDRVTATVEISARDGAGPLRFRDVFDIQGGRVRSLSIAPVRRLAIPRKGSLPPRSVLPA